MTVAENCVYIQSQVACALIECAAMQAANEYRKHRGESPAYSEEAFSELINKYGIHHNAVTGSIQDSYR